MGVENTRHQHTGQLRTTHCSGTSVRGASSTTALLDHRRLVASNIMAAATRALHGMLAGTARGTVA